MGGIDQGDHGVDRCFVSQAGAVIPLPFKCGGYRHWFGDTRGFDDDVVEAVAAGEFADGIHEVFAQGAADASVGQFHEAVFAAGEVAFGCDEGCVDVDF